MTVYVLKDQLKELWVRPFSDGSPTTLAGLAEYMAMNSGLAPVQQFARHLTKVMLKALSLVPPSMLEGMNNKSKVMKRMAYGYQDNDDLFLKIKAAFPPKVR